MHDLNWGSSCGGPLSELSSTNIPSSSKNERLTEQPDRLLQNLNCVGCPNIKIVVIPEITRCFHLSSLNLSLYANLKEVDVACFNLSFLNLRNAIGSQRIYLELISGLERFQFYVLFQKKSTLPKTSPDDFCSRVWDACKAEPIINSPFVPSLQGNKRQPIRSEKDIHDRPCIRRFYCKQILFGPDRYLYFLTGDGEAELDHYNIWLDVDNFPIEYYN